MSTTITTEQQLRDYVASADPSWLIKHSVTCGISSAAFAEYESYLAAHPDQPAAHIIIQEQRPLSNLAAELLGRVHQSPQLFLIQGGEVKWAASHWSITAGAMAQAWEALS